MRKILIIIFIMFPLSGLTHSHIKVNGTTHQISFKNSVVALKERANGSRTCYIFTEDKGVFAWTGKSGEMQNQGYVISDKQFLSGYNYEEPENKSLLLLKKYTVPIKIFYTKNAVSNVSETKRASFINENKLHFSGLQSHWVLADSVCAGEKLTFMNTKGYKINFSKTFIRDLREPFYAYESCIENSSEFQFQNSSTNFKKDFSSDCWWNK